MKSAAVKKFLHYNSTFIELSAWGRIKETWAQEYHKLIIIIALFLAAYYFPLAYLAPITSHPFGEAVYSAFGLTRWYAREHVLLCLVPAFFIAGVIAVFVSQAGIIKYFGAGANKLLAYLVASVSGSVLAVCSCTILPIFAGIHKRGAGIGPASAFLYSGPAINILAIILTARILGFELGLARIIGAVSFSIIIGLLMALIYRKEEKAKAEQQSLMPEAPEKRPLWQTSIHFFLLVGILVFANWGQSSAEEGLFYEIYQVKWLITAAIAAAFAVSMVLILKINIVHTAAGTLILIITGLLTRFDPLITFAAGFVILSLILSADEDESNGWMRESWGFAKQIMPLLAAGVMTAGLLLGTPGGGTGLIPNSWISSSLGGNSVQANLFASVAGAFMYFATLTEIPIVQGLVNSGMGKGPALALLLSGPALSLPSMLVIRSVIGTRKTIVYVSLVILMSTISGFIYGLI